MKILLHIGQSKTGTSAIQAYLTLNREALRAAGIIYPMVSVGGMPRELGNHNALADALVGLSRYPYLSAEQYFESFFREAERYRAEQMILSAEHFFGGEPRIWDVPDAEAYLAGYRQKIAALAPFLDGNQVEVMAYLRPQVEWLASAISHTIRVERLIRPEAIYTGDRQFFELVQPLLRYHTLIRAWDEGLKPRLITCVPYERDTLHQQSSIADFLLRAGLDNMDLPIGTEGLEVNESLNSNYLEVKKILNQRPHSKLEERVIIACLLRLSQIAQGPTRYALAEDLVADVEAFVAEENRRLNQDYVQGGELKAKGDRALSAARPSEEQIAAAYGRFEREYRKPRYRGLLLSYRMRLFLRDRMPFLHTLLHQIKRALWGRRFRRQVDSGDS